jgi:hypothetical protein
MAALARLEAGGKIGYACPFPARQRAAISMLISLTTWNINSVRLRIDLVA